MQELKQKYKKEVANEMRKCKANEKEMKKKKRYEERKINEI